MVYRSKKAVSLLICTFLILSMFAGNIVFAAAKNDENIILTEAQFKDIEGHWAEEYINEWVEKGLVKGYQDGSFQPDKSITRAEFITIVNKAFGFKEISPVGFSDVSSSNWYAEDIKRAAAEGYITGYEDGTIRPNNKISRQEVAAILCKVLKLELEENTRVLDKFNDANEIPEWSKSYIGTAVDAGYIGGYPDGTCKPANSVTRAESITILHRALGNLYNEKGTFGPESGIKEIAGNVTVNSDGVTLRNAIIKGNLYLTSGIGDGDVYLENVTVEGKTIVSGGGYDSIHFNNFTGGEIIVIKVNGKVRIVTAGDTNVDKVVFESGGHLEGKGVADVYFLKPNENIRLNGDFEKVVVQANVNIEVTGNTTIEQMEIDKKADNAEINLNAKSTIKELTINAPAKILGEGNIEEADIRVDGVEFDKEPDKITLKEGVIAIIDGKEIKGSDETEEKDEGRRGGGGGGGGSSKPKEVKVNTVKLDTAKVTLAVYESVYYKNKTTLTATIDPHNATNKKVTWSSSDEDIATVIGNGLRATVKAVGKGEATITVKTEDGGKTATCAVEVVEESEEPEPQDSVSAISVTGVAKVGETLTAKVTPSEATVTYKWMFCDTEDGDYEAIEGATAKTYKLTADDVSKYIKVEVKGTGNYTGTKTSDPVGPIVEAPEEPEPVASTYKFSYEVPKEVIAGNEYTVPVTIEPKTVGDFGYDKVRFNIDVTTPNGATLQLLATDDTGAYDVAQIGYWGPANGFPIGKDYSEDTDFTAIFSDAGNYTITFSLVDLDAGKTLITETMVITVSEEDPEDPKEAFIAAFNGLIANIVVGEETIATANMDADENISVTFKTSDASAILAGAGVVFEALQDLADAESSIEINGQTFNLEEELNISALAQAILGEGGVDNFLKEKTLTVTYTANVVDKAGAEFTLEGSLTFTLDVEDPDEAKAEFIASFNDIIAEIKVREETVANASIDAEDSINVSFVTSDADKIKSGAGVVFEALQDLADAESSIEINGQTFNLEEELDISALAYAILGDEGVPGFIEEKTLTVSYTATVFDKAGAEFTLEGSLTFTLDVEDPDEAKAEFIASFNDIISEIKVGEETIATANMDADENISVTFKTSDASAILAGAGVVFEALQDLADAESSIEINGQTFNLEEELNISALAQAILGEGGVDNFLKEKTLTVTYTANVVDKAGTEFTLEGNLTFTLDVEEPLNPEDAKAAFLADLETAISSDVAAFEIDEDNITVTFADGATVDEIKEAANALVAQFLADNVSGTLIIGGENFNLDDENVAYKVAKAILDGMDPEEFLNEGYVKVTYSAVVTVDGATFNLEGKLTFQMEKEEPTPDPDEVKADFLEGLETAVSSDVAVVEIEGDHITVTFADGATVDEIKEAADALVAQLLADNISGKLAIGDKTFELDDDNVASEVAKELLDGMDPKKFLDEGYVLVTYEAEIAVKGVGFELKGTLTFQMEDAQ